MERSPLDVRLLLNCWLGNESDVRAILAQEPSILQRLAPADLRQPADAARNNELTAVKLMLMAGLPLDVPGQHNASALHWAAWHGNLELVNLLIARGASLEDASNDFKGTPLGWAIHGSENGWHRDQGDYPGVVRALLSAGAKIPSRTDGTPEVRKILESAKGNWTETSG
jgi:ankyrin repeat protein